MDKRIAEIKKKLISKKIKSYEAISELKEVIGQSIERDEKINNQIIEKLDDVNESVKGIKQPDFSGLTKTIKENKPVVNISLNEVVDLLKEILNKEAVQVNQSEIKWPKEPKDAIPVVLTDKTKRDFYNALSSLPMFSGGSINISGLATKELQEAMIDAVNNIEINAENINLNTDDLESLLESIRVLLVGTIKTEEQSPLDISGLATADSQVNGSQRGRFNLESHDGSEVMIGQFGELLVGHKIDDILVNFKYPYYNTDFDMKPAVVSGDGSVSVVDSLLVVSSASNGDAEAETKNTVRYRSGHTGFVDFTALFDGLGTGYAGGFDNEDGFFIKRVNGVSALGRLRGGVEVGIVSQASWNGDIDPTTIDWTKINIFRILYGYLGVANAIFQIRLNGWKTLHVMETEGALDITTVKNPTFPAKFKVSDGMIIKVGSINAGTMDGSDVSEARYFQYDGSGILSGTNLKTIAHFINKTTYKTVTNKIKASFLRLRFFVDLPAVVATGTVEIKIIKNPTFSGTPVYTDLDANNSVIAYDAVAAITPGSGRVILTDWIAYNGTKENSSAGFSDVLAESIGLYLLPGDHIMVTAQNVSGNTNVTVRIAFNLIELF